MRSAKLAFVFTALMSSSAFSQNGIDYMASPMQSHWDLTKNSPIECKMEHKIPDYGVGQFSSVASRRSNLNFVLIPYLGNRTNKQVNILSMPPNWFSGYLAETIQETQFFAHFDGYVSGDFAWSMLSTLNKGWLSLFDIQSESDLKYGVQVALSPVKFKDSFNQFSRCIARLLPYSFEDISLSVLHYQSNVDELEKSSMVRLAQIAEYIRYSSEINSIVLSTYTDSYGGKNINQRISKERVERVKRYLVEQGFDGKKIKTHAYGEYRPIATNSNPLGRNQNRRLVISLIK